jgi:hypothetical protein
MRTILLTSNLKTMMEHINTRVDRQKLAKTKYIITTTTTITSCTIEQKWEGYSKVGSWFRRQHWTSCCNCGVIRPNPHVSGKHHTPAEARGINAWVVGESKFGSSLCCSKILACWPSLKKSSLIAFSHQNIHLMWIFQHNPKNHLISYMYYVYWSWCG